MTSLDNLSLQQETHDEFIRHLVMSVVKLTNASNEIPSCDDKNAFDFYATTDPSFLESSANCSGKLTDVILGLCSYVKPNYQINAPDDLSDSSLYEVVVDVIDSLLETSDILLDTLEGKKSSSVSNNIAMSLNMDKDRIFQSNCLNIVKPQTLFAANEVENSREHPFYPKIRSKPHASVPLNLRELPYTNDEDDDEEEAIRPTSFFPHPYETEILNLKYPASQLSDKSISNPLMPPSDQPFQYIDDEDDFYRALDEMAGLCRLLPTLFIFTYLQLFKI